LPNIVVGGHSNQSNKTRITAFITRAIAVSRLDNLRFGAPGQIPEKSRIPRLEITEDTTASGLHASPGTRVPHKPKDAAMKPKVERSQKGLAIIAAALGDRDGSSQERTGTGA
jgi:hypothetical protein